MATTTVDNHIVNMQLNNQDFEKNASQSLSTIDKLKNSLAFKGASNGLNAMANTTRSLTTALASGVQSAGNKFKLLEVASLTVMSRISNAAIDLGKKLAGFLTAPLNQIKTGGWTRAANIDQAKFQLKGLGIEWKDVVEDLNYAVQDTAYGLDSAAKAASQFAASGVKLGDEMKKALRGVSGVAAMTNSEYDDIARIFATVSGNGRLMTMQLNQLGARGLNIAAELGKQLGKTEKEIREMVTQGKIDFKTFAKAMDDAFGQHAKDADKTFTGSFANVKAALSRIGADFAAPIRDNLIPVFNALKAKINEFKAALGPVYKEFNKLTVRASKWLTNFISSKSIFKAVDVNNWLWKIGGQIRFTIYQIRDDVTTVFNNIKETFSNVGTAIKTVAGAIIESFRSIFSQMDVRGVSGLFARVSEAIKNFSSRLILSGESLEKVKSIFRGFFAFLNIVKMAFMNLAQAISPVLPVIKKLGSFIFDTAAKLGEYVVQLNNTIEANNKFASWFSPVRKIFEFLRSGISGIVGLLKGAVPYIKKAFEMAKGAFLDFTDSMSGSDIIGGFSLAALIKVLNTSIINITSMVGVVKKNFVSIFTNFRAMFANTNGVLRQMQNTLKAGTLTKLSVAIALLAGSLFLLSLIDPSRLLAASLAMKALFVQMASLMTFLSAFKTDWSAITLAPVLISIGIAMLFLVGALKKLSTIDIGGLLVSMIALKLLINMMVSCIRELNAIGKGGAIMKGATQLVILSAALMLMVSVIKKLSKIDPSSMMISLIGLWALLKILVNTVRELSLLDKINIGAGKLVVLGIALNIIAVAVKQIAALSPEQAVVGVVALGAILNLLASYVTHLSMIGSLKSLPGVWTLATAISILSGAIIKLGQDGPQTLTGIAALYLMMEGLLFFARSLSSMKGFTSVKVASLARSMVLLSAALTIMAVPVMIFSSIGFQKAIIGIGALAAMISVLVVAAKLLNKVKIGTSLLKIARVALIFSASMALIGVGVFAFSAGLTALAASGTAVVLLIKEVLKVVMEYLPKMARACILALNELVKTFLEILPELLEKVSEAIILLLESLNENLPEFIRLGSEMLISIMEGLEEELPRLVDKFFEMMITLIDSLTEALDKHGPELARAVMDFIGELIQTILSFIGEFFKAGEELFNSMGGGIGSAVGEFLGSIGALVGTILAAFDDPSKWEDVGRRLGEAFCNALEAVLKTFEVLVLEPFATTLDTIIEKIAGFDPDTRNLFHTTTTAELVEKTRTELEKYRNSIDDTMTYLLWFESEHGLVIERINDKEWNLDFSSATERVKQNSQLILDILNDFGIAAQEVSNVARNIQKEITDTAKVGDYEFRQLLRSYEEYGLKAKNYGKLWELDFSEANSSILENKDIIIQTLRDLGYEIEEVSKESASKVGDGISSGVDADSGVIKDAGEKVPEVFASGISENGQLPIDKAEEIEENVTDALSKGDESGSIFEGGANKVQAQIDGMESKMGEGIAAAEEYDRQISDILAGIIEKVSRIVALAGAASAVASGVTVGSNRPGKGQKTRKGSQTGQYAPLPPAWKGPLDVISIEDATKAVEKQNIILEHNQELAAYDPNNPLHMDAMKKSAEELAQKLAEVEGETEDANDALKKGTGGSNKTKEDIEKTTESFEKFKEAVKGAVESGISIFEEFNKKTELTGKQLLKNMRSQISGVTEWAVNLDKLAQRGISQGLLKHLAEMGPESYEQVRAFTQMTQEELAEANNLFAASLKVPGAVSVMLGDSWKTAGQMMNAGLTLGLQQNEEAVGAIQTTSDELLTTFKAAWGIASPSAVAEELGMFIMRGLSIGLKKYYTVYVWPVLEMIQRSMIQKFKTIGIDAMKGFEDGIREQGRSAISAAEEIAKQVASIMASALEEHSPSRVTMRIGQYVSEGLALGIRNKSNEPVLEAERLAYNTRNAIESALSILDADEPVIRPVLDLSGVIEEAKHLDSVFNDPTLSGRGRHYISNASNSTNGSNGASVVNNFTQNNYSPKALSRLEIYRQTRSQLRQASLR